MSEKMCRGMWGTAKGTRSGGTCRQRSTWGERGEEQLLAVSGEKSRVGLGETGEESRHLPGLAGGRRVCWEMPCKVCIPCCLFTGRKFPAGCVQAAVGKNNRMPKPSASLGQSCLCPP